jgi:galactokinase
MKSMGLCRRGRVIEAPASMVDGAAGGRAPGRINLIGEHTDKRRLRLADGD